MYLPSTFSSLGNNGCLKNVEDDHDEFTERLRKSLYYGKLPGTDRPSLPLTDMAVEFFQEAAPKQLGKLDTYLAASTSRSACMSPCSVAVGMMYVQRLRRRQPDYLTQISSSELFLISMMMASKFMYDEGVDEEVFNDEWAESGDMDVEDVNQLEREFLSAIDWQLFVRPDEFADMLHLIEKRIALHQGLDRGWFSYSDLCILSENLKWMNWNDLAAELAKVISVSSLAYFASIWTMIGSTVLATTTSATLITFGTTMLPLYCKLPPFLSLQPVLFPDVTRSTIDGEIVQSDMEVMNFSSLEAVKNLHPSVNNSNVIFGASEQLGQLEQRNNQESLEDNSEETELRYKDHGSLFNGFLPPFLALIALKDTFVKFAYAVGGEDSELKSHLDEHSQQNGPTMTEICSHGPCLIDSWANCWNVSSEHDWTGFKSIDSYSRCCKEQQCKMNSKLNTEIKGTVNGRKHDGDKGGNLNTIHCCCSVTDDPALLVSDYGSLLRLVPDLSLGFTTAPSYPVFITT